MSSHFFQIRQNDLLKRTGVTFSLKDNSERNGPKKNDRDNEKGKVLKYDSYGYGGLSFYMATNMTKFGGIQSTEDEYIKAERERFRRWVSKLVEERT